MRDLLTGAEANFIKKTIGERIRMLRLKFGMSQEELAETVNECMSKSFSNIDTLPNITRFTVVRWEAGQNFPSTTCFACLVRVFNCSAEYLCGMNDSEYHIRETKADNIQDLYLLKSESIHIIPVEDYNIYHEKPVLLNGEKWGILNAKTNQATTVDGAFIDVDGIPLYARTYGDNGICKKEMRVSLDEAKQLERVWIEAISMEEKVRSAYRGWYHYNPSTHCFEGNAFLHEDGYAKLFVISRNSPFAEE